MTTLTWADQMPKSKESGLTAASAQQTEDSSPLTTDGSGCSVDVNVPAKTNVRLMTTSAHVTVWHGSVYVWNGSRWSEAMRYDRDLVMGLVRSFRDVGRA